MESIRQQEADAMGIGRKLAERLRVMALKTPSRVSAWMRENSNTSTAGSWKGCSLPCEQYSTYAGKYCYRQNGVIHTYIFTLATEDFSFDGHGLHALFNNETVYYIDAYLVAWAFSLCLGQEHIFQGQWWNNLWLMATFTPLK